MSSLGRLALCLICAALFLVGCQSYIAHTILPHDARPVDGPVGIERNVSMRTLDGVLLVADIYRPRSLPRAPTILVRIPFTNTVKNRLGADAVGNFWASRGYNVVIQGTRGRYRSEGDFYPLLRERQDGIDTLAWLEKQPWFDGRLGMWGGSAFGHTQWAISDQTAPGPTALIIQIASSDFYGAFYPGGAFSLESALFWAARSHGTRDRTPSFGTLERGFANGPVLEADDRSIGDVGFFNDWATHVTRDEYWLSVDGENRARTLKAPVLLMAGWYDPFLPTQLRDFQAIRQSGNPGASEQSRLIVGPWTHADSVRFPDGFPAGDYRPASLAPTLPWFDHHLLGRTEENGPAAPVRLFVMGDNIWREEKEWPLARARYTDYYLHGNGHANSVRGDGRLEAAPTGFTNSEDQFDYDPRRPVPSRGGAMLGPRAGIVAQNDVEDRQDVLVYSSEPLQSTLEVTGPVRAVLHVSTDAPATDFTVKLVDVHPDGKAYNVSEGILRRTYPDASAMPLEIEVELWPTSMAFKVCHRIRIEVSSSNYPRFDRHPNTVGFIPSEKTTRIARQGLRHGPDFPSRIVLPVIPRTVEAATVASRCP